MDGSDLPVGGATLLINVETEGAVRPTCVLQAVLPMDMRAGRLPVLQASLAGFAENLSACLPGGSFLLRPVWQDKPDQPDPVIVKGRIRIHLIDPQGMRDDSFLMLHALPSPLLQVWAAATPQQPAFRAEATFDWGFWAGCRRLAPHDPIVSMPPPLLGMTQILQRLLPPRPA